MTILKNTKTTLLLTLLAGLSAHAALKSATYEVPVSKELRPFSIFPIEKLSLKKGADGQSTLKYVVPQELTGLKNIIEFSGDLSNQGGTLTSEYGDVSCVSNSSQMMCDVHYQKLNFDRDLAQKNMAAKHPGQDLSALMLVQERFSTEPVGIIRIDLKSRH